MKIYGRRRWFTPEDMGLSSQEMSTETKESEEVINGMGDLAREYNKLPWIGSVGPDELQVNVLGRAMLKVLGQKST